MDPFEFVDFEKVAQKFGLGVIREIEPLVLGIVNLTYTVKTENGIYMVQRLHSQFDERVCIDGLVVHTWLAARGVTTSSYRFTHDGRLAVRVGKYWWRVSKYLDHDYKPQDRTKNPERVTGAASLLARFHRELADFNHSPLFQVMGLHDPWMLLKRLQKIVAELSLVNKQLPERSRMIMPGLRRLIDRKPDNIQLIHGDPKYDNFLFRGNQAFALIDLDTIMRRSVLVDIADGLRGWCEKVGEKPEFDTSLFALALAAYRDANPVSYADEEVLEAIELINWQLAARFLIDSVEERYFRWDPEMFPSLREQNLYRCDRKIAYAESIALCRV